MVLVESFKRSSRNIENVDLVLLGRVEYKKNPFLLVYSVHQTGRDFLACK